MLLYSFRQILVCLIRKKKNKRIKDSTWTVSFARLVANSIISANKVALRLQGVRGLYPSLG